MGYLWEGRTYTLITLALFLLFIIIYYIRGNEVPCMGMGTVQEVLVAEHEALLRMEGADGGPGQGSGLFPFARHS